MSSKTIKGLLLAICTCALFVGVGVSSSANSTASKTSPAKVTTSSRSTATVNDMTGVSDITSQNGSARNYIGLGYTKI